ncbi:hypothetical protein LZ480_07425 [Solibacillus sp. MA9]|uniref:CXXC-20-CXXC protein n=1 Tax=Solibacillus palustris TaxID=2908203 RepID=A0ABS9UBK0_9BACL|nr:TIGR04104 family putative zinc finger protein [Solibacillus sp. MA9]MCH7321721.1 hypothetical protein [Solibacillus sp. MA9]
MMNNKQWKQELLELKLLKEQKKIIKERVFEQQYIARKKTFNCPVIIAPAFILLLAFCVLLIFTDSSSGTRIHQASLQPSNLPETDHSKYLQLHMRLSLAISIGIIINGFMAILIVMKTKRWQQTIIQKIRKIIIKSRYILTFLVSFLLYSFTVIASLVILSEQVKIIMIYLLVIVFAYLSILFGARNIVKKAYCPHCQHEFSRKEKRKLMMYFKMELRCHQCNGKLYYGKKTSQASGIITCIMSALLIIPVNFGVPFWVTFTCGVSMYAAVIYFLLPLFLQLEGEEKPLF